MTVVVSFVTPAGIGSTHAPGVGRVRVRENITVPGTTTASLAADEIVIVANGEDSMVAAALGTAPDADAAASTAATQAGVGVAAGTIMPLVGKPGEKVNIKALS